jgi:competence protein ComEC
MKSARLAFWLFLLLIPLAMVRADARVLTVAMLDVGQGDAIYIQAPNGKQMIVDGGPGSAIRAPLSQVLPFGDTSIDVLMIGNTDADHYSGFLSVLDSYHVGAVVEPGTHPTTKTYAALEKKISDLQIPHLVMRRGTRIVLDAQAGVVFTVLFPDRDVSKWSTNDGSIMGTLTYGSTRMFFTSDGTKKGEGIILSENSPELLRSDILKVGHHGSATSTSDAFVQTLAPQIALISAGLHNSYGLPKQVTLDTLARHGVQVHRTDIEGTLIYVSDGSHFIQKK